MSSHNGTLDTVMIDFEQRLGPSSWSPPEIHYISYIAHLASFSPSPDDKARYTRLMCAFDPTWKKQDKNSLYKNSPDGYCVPWPAFTKKQRESAQVFMLGKLLWCVFESTPTLNTAITIDTFREEETDISFPEFRHTPGGLRDCIRQCTAGAMEWEGRYYPVIREADRMVPRGKVGNETCADDVADAMKRWWRVEIERAEEFVQAMLKQKSNAAGAPDEQNEVLKSMRQRPSLREVSLFLEKAEIGAISVLHPT
jgi:hypothetical protein